MASSQTFTHLANGTKFFLDGFPANADGTAFVFTKTSDTTATDSDSRTWDFTPSQGLVVHPSAT